MPDLCKKHGKPRTVIYERKMPKGGTFSIVGCADCAAAAATSPPAGKKNEPPTRKPPAGVRRF
jgi:hypothetical protein